jgi:hypothetical protein
LTWKKPRYLSFFSIGKTTHGILEVEGSIPFRSTRRSPEAETSYVYLSTVESAAENPEYCRMFCKSEVSPMPRPRLQIPAYRKHSSGRAVVSVYRADGSRSEILLPGPHGSEESKQEYERVLAVLRANAGKLADRQCKAFDLTIAELIARFMEERVATYYVNPATKEPTGEQENFASAMRPLNRLFGSHPVARASAH